ncbi:MAG: sulfotransferase family protein, partial [Nitrososphaerales archaeon]
MTDAAPTFVLCVPRSGSTLLRLFLDSHPDTACPPETNFALVVARLEEHVARTFHADGDAGAAITIRLAREVAGETLGEYARLRGKRRWAEKSLTSLEHADALYRCFPDARFVCLVRECRDTIVSMLEASPYGLAGLGLPTYAERHPTNTVAACAEMWADRVSAMLTFEANRPRACLRVRYEDMVRRPAETMSGLCRFLDLEWIEDLLSPETLLDPSRQTGYGGDAKVWYRTPFDPSLIGRGLR